MNCNIDITDIPPMVGCGPALRKAQRFIPLDLNKIDSKALKILFKKCSVLSVSQEPPHGNDGRNEIHDRQPIVIEYFYQDRPHEIHHWTVKTR